MDSPPVIEPRKPQPKSVRFAATLNLILPGAGQFYLGQRVLGCVLAVLFLACLIAMFIIFFVAYARYLRVALNPFEGQQLEKLKDQFHIPWQVGLLASAILLWLISLAALSRARSRETTQGETDGPPTASKS